MAIKLTGDPHGIEPVVEETVLDKNGKPKKHFYFGNLLVTFSKTASTSCPFLFLTSSWLAKSPV